MENQVTEYAPVLIKLLQGVIYDEEKHIWSELLTHQSQIRAHFAKMGLELFLSEQEGFAFLKQVDDEESKLPRLVRRVSFTYEMTLLCVVLREALDDFDSKEIHTTKCFITDKEIREKLEMLVKDQPNRVKLFEKFDQNIEKMEKLGFLKQVRQEGIESDTIRYEIRRIIKAKVTNDELERIKQELTEHVNTFRSG